MGDNSRAHSPGHRPLGRLTRGRLEQGVKSRGSSSEDSELDANGHVQRAAGLQE